MLLQSLCYSTLFRNLTQDSPGCQWRLRKRQKYVLSCVMVPQWSEKVVGEGGRQTSCWRVWRAAWNPLMSMSDTGPTNPVLKCKYSAQCIGYYMMCHVCIAWHIVTNCGNAPSWYVPRPAAGKRSNSRVLFQDSVTLSSCICKAYMPESHTPMLRSMSKLKT